MNQLWGVNGGCCRAVKVCVVAQLEMPQSMSFPLDYYNRELAGKPKGMKCMLKERGLWPERGLVLECPTTHNRPGCTPEGGCCARRVLEAERDFQDQKGRLQEEVGALGR